MLWFSFCIAVLLTLTFADPECYATPPLVLSPSRAKDCYELADAIGDQWQLLQRTRRFTQNPTLPTDFKVPHAWGETRAGRTGCQITIDLTVPGQHAFTTLLRVEQSARGIINDCIDRQIPQIGLEYISANRGLIVTVEGIATDPEFGIQSNETKVVQTVAAVS